MPILIIIISDNPRLCFVLEPSMTELLLTASLESPRLAPSNEREVLKRISMLLSATTRDLTLHRRELEIRRSVQKTFESVIMTQLFPRTQIDIFVQVLQSDGGVFSFTLE